MSQPNLGGGFTFPGTKITVRRMGYGAMQLPGPHVWGPPRDRDAALAVLREVVRLGMDHIDTSDFYGPFVSNQLIAEALQPYPESLTIVSKIGARRGEDSSWLLAASPAELRSGVQDNLTRLGLDAIDIVNMRFHSDEQPIAEAMETVVQLQKEGLIRHIGVSNVTHDRFREAQSIAEIVCVQNLYNLSHRRDDALIDDLAAQGIAFVPFFPLGGFSPLQSSALDRAANELGASPLQVALAWLLQRSPNILLIPGTSSVDHLHENVKAADLEIPEQILRELDTMGTLTSA